MAVVVAAAAGITWKFTVCCTSSGTADIAHADLAPEPVAFVGTETCISCHQKEGALWHASQHAHAMAHATADTVLGDFDDASFDYYGVKSRFFKKDGKFFVETDGPDGKLATFEVKYTFGLDPLQQYLVEFPDGRIQALSLAWDTRPKEEGGQRWFHLYPDENITHDDPLHWTKLNQNWNFMCAECHSTGVAKNYNAAKDSFATTWKEISIGCEACHGQGSAHVAWAKSGGTDGCGHGSARPLRRAFRRHLEPGPEDRPAAAQRVTRAVAERGRDVRALPCAARRDLGRLGAGTPALRHPCRVAARPRALSGGRTDAGRGLQLRLVQAEQDVRQGRDVQRLPRPAQCQAPRIGQSSLPAMPCQPLRDPGAHPS